MEDEDMDNDGLLEASGKLNIKDRDAGEAAFIATTTNGNYGYFVLAATGNWYYAADNNQAVIQNLGSKDTLTDQLITSSVDGTSHPVVITIKGVNDTSITDVSTTTTNQPAVISGTDSGSVTEDVDPDGDNLLETTGKLNVTDNDAGEAAFIARTRDGHYGNLTIDTAGNWRYTASNAQTAIQNLVNGQTITDSLTVNSIDGTAQNVVIAIHGVDEASTTVETPVDATAPDINTDPAPVIDQVSMYSYNANLTGAQPLSGAVLEQTTVYMFFDDTPQYSSMDFYCCKGVSGENAGEAHSSPVIDSSAPYVYSVDLSQYTTTGIRELYVDRIRKDGTGIDNIYVNFSINISTIVDPSTEPSVNTPAVITGVDQGSVTEDVDPDGDSLLETNGKLNVTDSDAGEAAFIARTRNGNYGSLTIDTAGNWRYAASNTQTAIQNLVDGQILTDSLVVNSIDGTVQTVVITILGADETSTPAEVTLSWVAPAEREDDSALSLSAIAGYRIYYGNSQNQYTNEVTINDSTATEYTFLDLPSGTYYFVVTTIDTDGRESQYSDSVSASL